MWPASMGVQQEHGHVSDFVAQGLEDDIGSGGQQGRR
jgi:hypothetical protein